MKTYKTLVELARTTRCHFATKRGDAWIPCRSDRNATHRFVYAIALEPASRKTSDHLKKCA